MIVKYDKKYLQDVLELFNLNVPDSFAPSEITELEKYIGEHSSTYFLYLEDEKVVGACGYYYPDADTGRISWIFTNPGYRGKRIGSGLVTHCISEIKAKSRVTGVVVWTSQFAYKFFEKFGFNLESVQADHWAKGYDLYLMKKLV